MNISRFVVVLVSALTFCTSAMADVLYQNGTLNGEVGAQITPPQSISNSFDIAARSQLTSVTLGLLSPLGEAPVSLTYSIGLQPFESTIATGSVALSNQYQFDSGDFSVYLSSFALNLILDPGTYYLTLSNGISTNGTVLAWDINGGPSQAFFRNNEDGDEGTLDSEFFVIEGNLRSAEPNPVPEPASLFILSTGLGLLISARRRKSSAAQ